MEPEILLKILLSAVLSGMIGLESYVSGKKTGLRSYILIAVGAMLFTIMALKLTDLMKMTDPSVLVAHIITGAGLLGAAMVIKERFTATGLISAASIWIVAAIGIAVGCGLYLTAFMVTLCIVGLLFAARYIANILDVQAKLYPYIITTDDRASILIEIKKTVTELGIKYINSTLRKNPKGYEIELTLNTSVNKNRTFMEKVMQIPGVKEVTSEHL